MKITDKQLHDRLDKLLEETKTSIDDLDYWFSQTDFREEGGIRPLHFNIDMFVKEFKKEGVYKDWVITMGMIYTLIYAETDLNGKNSTLQI